MSNLVTTRTVTILFTQAGKTEKVQSAATTWGELQREIEGNIKDKNCIVRETKNTLKSLEAVLPTGPFVIFAYPQESKAGALKKVAKKAAKSAKKVAKKATKSAPKKAAKKAAKRVSNTKSEKISKTVASVASAAAVNKPVAAEENISDLMNEANRLKRTM
jgi:hypothetical protein